MDKLEDHCDTTSATELERKESQEAATVEEGNSKKNEVATFEIDPNNVQESEVIAKTDSQSDTKEEELKADLPEQKCIVEDNSQTSPIQQSPDDLTAAAASEKEVSKIPSNPATILPFTCSNILLFHLTMCLLFLTVLGYVFVMH